MAGGGGGPLPHDNAVALYLALTLILLVARILGEIAKKLNQPSVMGELLAGVLLGKTCLYYISPSFFNYLFGPTTKNASALAGVTSICVTLYMLIAGLEMNLKNAMKKKKPAISVGFFSLAVPFALGFIFCYYFPETFGLPPGKSVTNFALFAATAMAITALPVVAKTLRDLHLFRTDLGVVVMSAAVFDDILGWSLFAVTLAVSAGSEPSNGLSVAASISISVVYVILVLTLGTWLTNKVYPYIQAYFSYPAGELGFICLFALASSTFALWIGLHNTLGAFIVGAAIGNSRHLRAEMHDTLDTFVSFMLAPIFFGSVCINANFVTDFSATVVFSIFFLSCAGKLIGGFLGAKLAGSSIRDSFAVAVCMNSRGAMELILAQVALDAGIIDGKVFVALVFMAIVTSIIPGPMLRRILKRPTSISVMSIIPRKAFFPNMKSSTMQGTIQELAAALHHPEVSGSAIEKELSKNEPSYDGLAVASVLCKDIKRPLAALGIFPSGIVWNPRLDEKNVARFVVLLVIPESTHTMEFDLMREVSQLFSSHKFQDELLNVGNHVELQALLQIEKYRMGMAGHNPNPTPVIAVKETGMIAVDVNDIINDGSPRPSPASPEMMLSPRALNALQGHALDLSGDGNENSIDDIPESSMVELKKRPIRRETSKSLRETIEEYVSATPGMDTVPETSEVLRRLSALQSPNLTLAHDSDQSLSMAGDRRDVEQGLGIGDDNSRLRSSGDDSSGSLNGRSVSPRVTFANSVANGRPVPDSEPLLGEVISTPQTSGGDKKDDDKNQLGLV